MENEWIAYEFVAENSPYFASALCSTFASVLLLIHSIMSFKHKEDMLANIPASLGSAAVFAALSGTLLVVLELVT